MDEIVILTGFMGTGKSATGRELAELLAWEFVDLDEEIERTARKSVPRIFAEEGEAVFRDLESRELESALRRSRAVIAAGGGILLRPENRAMLESRLVVNLDASPEECVKRLQGSSTDRPLLSGPDPVGVARRIYEARRPLYEGISRRVATDGRSPEDVAREIAARFLDRGAREGES